jgi:hypothetical protein
MKRRGADALRRRIRGYQFRVSLFEFDQLSKKAIVLRVGNIWAIFNVVQVVVVPDFVPEGLQSS